MKKFEYVLFFSVWLAACQTAIGQRQTNARQRAKIDSLSYALVQLKGENKVDCLNSLAFEFAHQNSDSFIHWSYWNPDTSRTYSIEAYNLATAIQYVKGRADALYELGQLAFDSNFAGSEAYFRKAIPLYKSIQFEHGIHASSVALGWALYAQGRYHESIDELEAAIQYCLRADDMVMLSTAYRILNFNYGMQGYKSKAFEYAQKDDSLRKLILVNSAKNLIYSAANMANFYESVGDHEKANYYRRISEAEQERHYKFPESILESIAETQVDKGIEDSADYYYRLARKTAPVGNFNLGEYYYSKNNFAKALPYFREYLQIKLGHHDFNQVLFTVMKMGRIFEEIHQYDSCLWYARQLSLLARSVGARDFLADSYELSWRSYEHFKKIDSAYTYHLRYTAMKDSLRDDEFISKVAKYEMKARDEQQKAQLLLLNRENQLKQSKLNENSISIIFFIGVIIATLFALVFLYYHYKLLKKKDKLQLSVVEARAQIEIHKQDHLVASLEKEKTELEMQALRAQMSPHFIFNSLNSINRFILQNDRTQASAYLTKFSRLVRMILQNSNNDFITLESELESLALYLDLESLRFDYRFGYKISVSPDVDTSAIKIPPLIIQPYAENAIWHGLMHREEKGQLDIDVSYEEDSVYIRVGDNGIGRAQAAAMESKSATLHKSMGLQITANRIAIIENSGAGHASVHINDLANPDGSAAGTEVIIRIPTDED